MTKSNIEWTEEVWNPLTGCTKIGQGCVHCYAEIMARRLKAMGQPQYQDAVDDKGRWTGKITLVHEKLTEPLRWKKPRMIFVNSMSDLFHKDVQQSFIGEVLTVMCQASWHTFQVLTKRYDRVPFALTTFESRPNILFGYSICNQDDADKAREALAAVQEQGWKTWVSYEPALGPVNWKGFEFIDWLVVGGESGAGHRPFSLDWAYAARDWCLTEDVSFFMKQLGGHPNKRDQMEDFPLDLRIREFPQ